MGPTKKSSTGTKLQLLLAVAHVGEIEEGGCMGWMSLAIYCSTVNKRKGPESKNNVRALRTFCQQCPWCSVTPLSACWALGASKQSQTKNWKRTLAKHRKRPQKEESFVATETFSVVELLLQPQAAAAHRGCRTHSSILDPPGSQP